MELVIQERGGPLPLALQEYQVAGSQLDAHVWRASLAAPLRPGRYAAIAEHLGEENIDSLLADGFGVVPSNRQTSAPPVH